MDELFPTIHHSLKFFAGFMQTAFYGADRDFQVVCYFLVFVSLKMHQKGHAVSRRQGIEHFLNVLYAHIYLSLIGNGTGALKRVSQVFNRLAYNLCPALLAVLIDERVAENGGHPGAEIGTQLEPVAVPETFNPAS